MKQEAVPWLCGAAAAGAAAGASVYGDAADGLPIGWPVALLSAAGAAAVVVIAVDAVLKLLHGAARPADSPSLADGEGRGGFSLSCDFPYMTVSLHCGRCRGWAEESYRRAISGEEEAEIRRRMASEALAGGWTRGPGDEPDAAWYCPYCSDFRAGRTEPELDPSVAPDPDLHAKLGRLGPSGWTSTRERRTGYALLRPAERGAGEGRAARAFYLLLDMAGDEAWVVETGQWRVSGGGLRVGAVSIPAAQAAGRVPADVAAMAAAELARRRAVGFPGRFGNEAACVCEERPA
ncbi:MAG TPA: hypothetical protein VF170_01010 [Planctomycetaceae bacterium]